MSDNSVRRITWRSADVARVLSLGVFFLFLWKFFWMVHTALFLGLIAVLIAIVFHAPAHALGRWIPFKVAFPLVVLLILSSLIGLLIVLVPQIIDQLSQLATLLPPAMEQAARWIETKTGAEHNGETLQRINEQVSRFVARFVPLAFNLISVAVGSIAIVVLAIFFAAQPHVYRDLLLLAAPRDDRASAERIYQEAGRNLRAWVLGKLLTMLMTGVFIFLWLTLFGVPGALALAALAAMMEFIPNFGPTIAAAPAIVSAFLVSPTTAMYVGIGYFVFQQVQTAITVPLVERRAVDIPPAVLLLWQLMLAVGFGILGLFIATPLLAVLVVALRVLYWEPSREREEWDRRDTAVPVEPLPAAPGG